MTATILLVEDDIADQALVRRAVSNSGLEVDLRVVSEGESALDYLQRLGEYADAASAPRPDLVLLDLNLPRIDGREVLKQVRARPELRSIPIVVLSTSDHPRDVEQAYALGANSYVTKPAEMADYVRFLRRIAEYWFELVQLPKAS